MSADRDQRASRQFRGDGWSVHQIPAVVGFVDRDYRYKSVATQIPHDSGVIPTPYMSQKSLPYLTIESAPHPLLRVQGFGALNRVSMCPC